MYVYPRRECALCNHFSTEKKSVSWSQFCCHYYQWFYCSNVHIHSRKNFKASMVTEAWTYRFRHVKDKRWSRVLTNPLASDLLTLGTDFRAVIAGNSIRKAARSKMSAMPTSTYERRTKTKVLHLHMSWYLRRVIVMLFGDRFPEHGPAAKRT